MILSLRKTPLADHLRWDLILYKALSSLQAEISRSRLGAAWWVLDPILYMAVFYVIFELVFQRGGPGFIVKLLVALVIWRWFDSSVKNCGTSLINGIGLMRQVYVSKFLFPLSALLSQLVKFTVVLSILLCMLAIYGIEITSAWFGLIPVLLAQASLIIGLGLCLAALIPFAPDMKIVIDYALQVGFFMSGVFFEVSRVPEHLQTYFYLNPMATLIDQARHILLYQQSPDWFSLGMVTLLGLTLAMIGSALLIRNDRDYPTLLLS